MHWNNILHSPGNISHKRLNTYVYVTLLILIRFNIHKQTTHTIESALWGKIHFQRIDESTNINVCVMTLPMNLEINISEKLCQ